MWQRSTSNTFITQCDFISFLSHYYQLYVIEIVNAADTEMEISNVFNIVKDKTKWK